MSTKANRVLGWMGALFMAAFLLAALPQRAAADDNDPPGRAARLNYLNGSVSFQPAGESDWVPAIVNRPLTTGDRLWADEGARAEMHIGSVTIRLDAGTGFSFLNLDDNVTQIELTEGVLNIRVLRLDRGEVFEVDTPNQAFSILQAGQYRLEASSDGNSTLVTVRGGNGEVTGGGRTYSIGSGLTGDFEGTDSLHADIFRADNPDEFDNWCQNRDRREDGSRSAQYVSRDLVGYEDLDDNGSWRSEPEYGDVWVPRVSAGWAPYREGHWAWISPWGWTWVDDAPWGYAPFHYGRWVYARNNWCWVPGPIAVRPVYAPALVVFVGGPSFGLSVSFGGGRGGGNVGWFPLGPREVYVPGYRASREYVTRVNVSNTTVNNTTVINVYNNQVTNNDRGNGGNNRNSSDIRYANRNVPGGVTAVSQTTFASAQPVGRAVIAVDQRALASAPVSGRAEVAPTRNSVFGTSVPRGNRVPQPPAAVTNRSVVAKTPPPPPPVSFERQQQKLVAQPGQPLARNEVEGLRPANVPAVQPRVRQAPPGRPAAADTNQPGNRPAGNFGRSNQPPPNIGGNPPANNAPPARNDRPNGPNRGQQQPNPPPAALGANPPLNNAPPARNDRPNGPNRGQPDNVQPSNPPPAAVGANPPANNAPPARNDRPNGPSRGQPDNVQPSNPPPVSAAPPVNNAPPARNDRQNGPNRGQPQNVQPSNPPPVSAPPPANNATPTRNDRSNGPNRGQPADQPASPPQSARPANQPPPKEQPPQKANDKDKKDGEKQKNQDDKQH